MWNEPSAGVAVAALDSDRASRQPAPAVVASVVPGSIGEELGFEPGDQLLSINGIRPRDLIDYRYLIVEEELHLEIRDAAGVLHHVDLERMRTTVLVWPSQKHCSMDCVSAVMPVRSASLINNHPAIAAACISRTTTIA